METYPIIRYSDALISISKSLPPLPAKPPEPQKPKKFDVSNFPPEPTKPSSIGSTFLISTSMFFLGIGAIYLSTSTEETNIIFMLFGVLWIVAGPLAIIQKLSNFSKEDEEYENKLKQYEDDMRNYEMRVKNIERDFQQATVKHETIDLPKYQRAIINWQREVDLINSHENVKKYRLKKIPQCLLNSILPAQCSQLHQYKKGVSEGPFFIQLNSFFPGKIFTSYSIGENPESRNYLPDFTYFDSVIKLCIDIEIDEPYIGSTGDPIHYIGIDEKRDRFFNENGWIVIRFAEEQVVNNAKKCCDIIRNVVTFINSGEFIEEYPVMENFSVSRWDKEKAHRLAFSRARNKYLGLELREKLEEEVST